MDWKSKQDSVWKINKNAFNSYLFWSKKLNIPILIAFILFDEKDNLTDLRFSVLNVHKFNQSKKDTWDKNKTVVFESELPFFTKFNLLKAIKIMPY